jgi:hypothetical protein
VKVTIPNDLKSAVPQTTWGKILSATPVVMAVVATMLAGLASSEMTKAQYDRSLAAQQQSKAGDQWNFFQAKRLRAATQRNTLDLLLATTDVGPLSAAALKRSPAELSAQMGGVNLSGSGAAAVVPAAASAPAEDPLQSLPQWQSQAEQVKSELLAALDAPETAAALKALAQAKVPETGPEPVLEAKLKAALDAFDSSQTDKELAPLVVQVNDKVLEDALHAAKDRAAAFDAATAPGNAIINRLEALLGRQTALIQEVRAMAVADGASFKVAGTPNREFIAARLRYMAARYDTEAKLNQAIGRLYEMQVRRSNLTAERHHLRSQRFFFGMLAAQMGVIVSTFAIAARAKNLLWSFAAAAGVLAVAFGAYVYLFV